MAIQEQLDVLRQRAMEWNSWREQNREVPIGLSDADLSRVDLSDANLSRVDLSRANLSDANLSCAKLNSANLSDANLSDANLSGANLSRATLSRADLSGADLSFAHLSGANLSRANLSDANLSRAHLSRADLSGADLDGADLDGAHLSGADLSGAHLSFAHLSRADLDGANLSGAILSRADFIETNLSDTNLSDAILSGANLIDATLSGANLSGATLIRAHLSATILSDAQLSGAQVGWTTFGDLDLRTVKGLETIQHQGPSEISTSTLERSEGDIPDVFLREAGLSETFLTYVRSLTQSPIQYYTCFISYSSKDQKFAERLHADLQQKGIKCWFAPEDLKIGEKFPHRIDEAIRQYDKLLIILSQNSIHSSWVKKEVQIAEEKEERLSTNHPNQTVLFPIKIDKSIEECRYQWVAKLQRERHIGDFTRWKYHTPYEKAFQRLMRDLQPDQQ